MTRSASSSSAREHLLLGVVHQAADCRSAGWPAAGRRRLCGRWPSAGRPGRDVGRLGHLATVFRPSAHADLPPLQRRAHGDHVGGRRPRRRLVRRFAAAARAADARRTSLLCSGRRRGVSPCRASCFDQVDLVSLERTIDDQQHEVGVLGRSAAIAARVFAPTSARPGVSTSTTRSSPGQGTSLRAVVVPPMTFERKRRARQGVEQRRLAAGDGAEGDDL